MLDNLEKAKQASLIAADIESHKSTIESLKETAADDKYTVCNYKNGSYKNIKVNGFYVEASEDIYNFLIQKEKTRLKEAEQKLDELLNGPVNKIKEYISSGGDKNASNN